LPAGEKVELQEKIGKWRKAFSEMSEQQVPTIPKKRHIKM
jgi:hypothetical protein